MTGFPGGNRGGKIAARDAVEGERKIVRPENQHRPERREHRADVQFRVNRRQSPTSLRARRRRPGATGRSCAAIPRRRGAAISAARFRRARFRPVQICAPRCARRSASEILRFVPAAVVRKMPAAPAAASSASSQSAQALTGNSPGNFSPVAGFSAWKVPPALAARHWPAIKTGCVGMMF